MPEERKVFLEIVARFVVPVEIDHELDEDSEFDYFMEVESEAFFTSLNVDDQTPETPELWDSEILEKAVFVEEPDSKHEGTSYHYVRTEKDAKYLKGTP